MIVFFILIKPLCGCSYSTHAVSVIIEVDIARFDDYNGYRLHVSRPGTQAYNNSTFLRDQRDQLSRL
jgi:hypothetical protein